MRASNHITYVYSTSSSAYLHIILYERISIRARTRVVYELAHHVLYSSMHTVVVKALGMDMHIMHDSS